MKALTEPSPESENPIVDLVDFKWLMAGHGWWVDVARLQRDAAYARTCVAQGIASGSSVLRRRSVQVQPLLARAHANH